jgi:hypothetical protein
MKSVISQAIIFNNFDSIDAFESLGLPHDDVEDTFISIFTDSTTLLGIVDQIPDKFFKKLKLTDRFFKNEKVVKMVKAFCEMSDQVGDHEKAKSLKVDFGVDFD